MLDNAALCLCCDSCKFRLGAAAFFKMLWRMVLWHPLAVRVQLEISYPKFGRRL